MEDVQQFPDVLGQSAMKIRAVYPGSFDPITNGHIYIAERAAAVFDEVIVSVLINERKTSGFTVEERCDMARESLAHVPNITVGSFNGLLVDYVSEAAESWGNHSGIAGNE